MATIDSRLVDKELKAIVATSQAVKKLLYKTLSEIEDDPGAYDAIRDLPEDVANLPNLVAIRKAKIISHRHDFRLLFAHWHFDEVDEDHMDLLLAFPRKTGYRIDWKWIQEVLRGK